MGSTLATISVVSAPLLPSTRGEPLPPSTEGVPSTTEHPWQWSALDNGAPSSTEHLWQQRAWCALNNRVPSTTERPQWRSALDDGAPLMPLLWVGQGWKKKYKFLVKNKFYLKLEEWKTDIPLAQFNFMRWFLLKKEKWKNKMFSRIRGAQGGRRKRDASWCIFRVHKANLSLTPNFFILELILVLQFQK